jgi:hypothetical protein
MRFFDVESDPPKRGRPAASLTYREFLDAVYHTYLRRNAAEFRWAEGDEEPLGVGNEVADDEDD